MEKGDKVRIASFEGGNPVAFEGSFVSMDNDHVTVEFEGKSYKFRRAPGSKSGYGIGAAAKWRLGLEERSKLCIPDAPRGRR